MLQCYLVVVEEVKTKCYSIVNCGLGDTGLLFTETVYLLPLPPNFKKIFLECPTVIGEDCR